MVLFLAALQGVPAQLYEAPSWDGAGAWTRFLRITVPLISPTILLTSIITVVGSLQVFAQIAVLTQGGPACRRPSSSTYLYQQAFQFHHFGYGATLRTVLLFAIVALPHRRAVAMRRRWVFNENREIPGTAEDAPVRPAVRVVRAVRLPDLVDGDLVLKPVSEIFAFPPRLLPADWDSRPTAGLPAADTFAGQYFNSLYIALIVTAGTMAVAAMAGYAFARIRFPGQERALRRRAARAAHPERGHDRPLFQMFHGLGLTDTHWRR
ncbi:ABC transporter permease subunit [Streptosporangium vulgare]|uniref:ABC transporter permease subunit n=1 Tax=Streptosporangium vulgare TaxID=46190 RepID=UPI0031D2B4F9